VLKWREKQREEKEKLWLKGRGSNTIIFICKYTPNMDGFLSTNKCLSRSCSVLSTRQKVANLGPNSPEVHLIITTFSSSKY
jgi:hypothetical protein